MNGWIGAAGLLATMTVIGHFAVGRRLYLAPMLAADFDPVARKVMHCVFHYVSVVLVLSAGTLMALGLKLAEPPGAALLLRYIALHYAAFAIWQLALAAGSGLRNAPLKLFQWIFFTAIALCSWLGAPAGG